MKSKFFNKKLYKRLIIELVVIILAILYSKTYVKQNIYNPRIDNSNWIQINNLGERHIKQKFRANENKISGIQVYIGTGYIEEDATLHYAILDENQNKLSESKVYQSNIKPGRFNSLFFENDIKVKKGSLYYIELYQQSQNDNCFILSYMEPRAKLDNTFFNNENETDGTIIVRFLTHRFSIETFIVFLVFSFIVIYFLRMVFYLFRQ